MNPGSLPAAATEPSSAPVRVLAVCTANISRSPAVERLLRLYLGDAVHATSAGVMALVGEPVDPPVAAWLGARGADYSGFAARQVEEAMLRDAELVLALTRSHRSRVLELTPSAVRRTFTLREFVRVAASLDLNGFAGELPASARLRALIPALAAGRALAPAPAEGEDDVPDPYGRGGAAYARSLGLVLDATRAIADLAGFSRG